jgi:hypothetical protein
MPNILGLDISTSCTGWCLLALDGTMVAMGYIPLSKLSGPFEKADRVAKELSAIGHEYDIADVFIEENLQAFRPGLSSAKTLLTLSRFNGIVSFICYNIFSLEPKFINVNFARKSLGIKIERERKCGISTKEQVRAWVNTNLDDTKYQWPIKILKSGPRKGQKIFDPVSYDMADAFVIALVGVQSRD